MLSPAWSLLDHPPYGLPQPRKEAALLPLLSSLTAHHAERCAPYARVVERIFGGVPRGGYSRLEDVPFVPAALFKDVELRSVPDAEVVKVLTSSGTTGQKPSRIALDAETARAQSAVLVKLLQHFLGTRRRPMVVIDHPNVIRDRASFSARGAALVGVLQFGVRPFYALREDLSLDLDGLRAYVAEAGDQPLLAFGLTFMLWQRLVEALADAGTSVDLSRATLLHTGGWKKLQERSVSGDVFRARLREVASVERVIDFYGMVEQVGSVFLENPTHFLHAPVFADVLIRDPVTLKPLPDGEVGLVQVLSCLPVSYPGHSILTEDLGVIRGADLREPSMGGRYFQVLGRVPRAEARGCSDTLEPGAAAA